MKIHLKKKMIKKIKSDLIHTKISMNKEIKMKREREIYMENKDMLQRN